MSEYHRDVLAVYRRIGKAYRKGRGVRLTAHEVALVWVYDNAIQGAVIAAEEEEDDSAEGGAQ